MEQDEKKKIEKGLVKKRLEIALASIIALLLFLAEIFVITAEKPSILAMLVLGVILAVDIFFLVSAVVSVNFIQKDLDREEIAELYRAQKASYLVIKKSFEELDNRLNYIEETAALPADEIISAQKAVAKVTINRSKESNDELASRIAALEEKIDSKLSNLTISAPVVPPVEPAFEEAFVVDEGPEEAFIVDDDQEEAFVVDEGPEEAFIVDDGPEEAYVVDESETPDDGLDLTDISLDDLDIPEIPDIPELEATSEEEVDIPDVDDLLAGLDIDNVAEDEVDAAEVQAEIDIPEEPFEELVVEDDEPEPMEELAVEPTVDEVVEEPVAEEPVAEEPVVEEPVIEEPIAEEPAADPFAGLDMSDPNKQLSADEIAALFANI